MMKKKSITIQQFDKKNSTIRERIEKNFYINSKRIRQQIDNSTAFRQNFDIISTKFRQQFGNSKTIGDSFDNTSTQFDTFLQNFYKNSTIRQQLDKI